MAKKSPANLQKNSQKVGESYRLKKNDLKKN